MAIVLIAMVPRLQVILLVHQFVPIGPRFGLAIGQMVINSDTLTVLVSGQRVLRSYCFWSKMSLKWLDVIMAHIQSVINFLHSFTRQQRFSHCRG